MDGEDKTRKMARKECRMSVAVIAVASVSLVNFIFIGNLYCTGLFFYHFLYAFGASKSETAMVTTLTYGSIYLSGVLSGTLTSKYGTRPTAILGSALSSIGLFLSVYVPDLWMVYITYGIFAGVGMGLLMHTGAVSVQQHTTKHRALAAGIAYLGSGLGALTMPLIFRYLESIYAWRGALLIMAGLQLNCLPAALLLIPPDPSYTNHMASKNTLSPSELQILEGKSDKCKMAEEGNTVSTEACNSVILFRDEKKHSGHIIQRISSILQDVCRTLRGGGLACVACVMASIFRLLSASALYTFLPMKVASIGLEPSTAAYLLSVTGMGDVGGRIASTFTGCLHNRLPLIYFVLATLGGGVFEACIGYVRNPMSLSVLVAGVGFTLGVQITVGNTVIRDIVGIEKFPWVLGLAWGASGINNFVSIQLMALLWQETGNLILIFVISGLCMACSGISFVIYLCICKGSKLQNSSCVSYEK